MQAITVLALIILVAYTATNADHAHHAGPAKHAGSNGEVIHWTTGTQTKGAATLNETKANTTDNPATSVEPEVPASAVMAGQNFTSTQESLLTAEAEEKEGHAAEGPAGTSDPTVEPESNTTTLAPTTSDDPSKKH